MCSDPQNISCICFIFQIHDIRTFWFSVHDVVLPISCKSKSTCCLEEAAELEYSRPQTAKVSNLSLQSQEEQVHSHHPQIKTNWRGCQPSVHFAQSQQWPLLLFSPSPTLGGKTNIAICWWLLGYCAWQPPTSKMVGIERSISRASLILLGPLDFISRKSVFGKSSLIVAYQEHAHLILHPQDSITLSTFSQPFCCFHIWQKGQFQEKTHLYFSSGCPMKWSSQTWNMGLHSAVVQVCLYWNLSCVLRIPRSCCPATNPRTVLFTVNVLSHSAHLPN